MWEKLQKKSIIRRGKIIYHFYTSHIGKNFCFISFGIYQYMFFLFWAVTIESPRSALDDKCICDSPRLNWKNYIHFFSLVSISSLSQLSQFFSFYFGWETFVTRQMQFYTSLFRSLISLTYIYTWSFELRYIKKNMKRTKRYEKNRLNFWLTLTLRVALT